MPEAAAPPVETALPADGCIRVPIDELPRTGITTLAAGRQQVVLCRLGDSFFAVGGSCPHRGAPMGEGDLIGAVLRCPHHAASFDVRTGERVRGPECRDLKSYTAHVDGDEVVIAVRPPAEREAEST